MRRFALCVAMVLCLHGVDAGACRAQQQRGTVYLGQSRDWHLYSGGRWEVTPLARELVRQAFLIAARDEMGLATRDAWLGDAMPTQGDNAPWDAVAALGDTVTVSFVRGFAANKTKYVTHELREPARTYYFVDYQKLTELEETYSRDQYVAGLKQAGYQAQANDQNDSTQVPESVEKLLGEMNLFSQFHAIRVLHGSVRKRGKSQALLGALSRAYANLGVLTEYYWHPAHKVFKARALLYAQRMLARDKDSPLPRWHRAYAAALVGVHDWALDDLKQANDAWQAIAEQDRPVRPAWVQVIEPICNYEVDALGRHDRDPAIGQLAAMLKATTTYQAGGKIWAVQTAVQCLERIPECYRVHDIVCEFGGVSVLHSATTEPIATVGKKLYGRIVAMPGLPGKVRAIAKSRAGADGGILGRLFGIKPAAPDDEFEARKQLVAALSGVAEDAVAGKEPAVDGSADEDADGKEADRAKIGPTDEQAERKAAETKGDEKGGEGSEGSEDKSDPAKNASDKSGKQLAKPAAGDAGEPSWATLGLLIRELSFMQVYRRASFERGCLDVPTDEWLATSAPLIDAHPYKAFLECLAWENDQRKKAVARLAKVDATGCGSNAWAITCVFENDDHAKQRLSAEIWRNVDRVSLDFVQLMRAYAGNQRESVWLSETIMKKTSPRCPLARAMQVTGNWEHIQAKVKEWDKESAPYPALSLDFGMQYLRLGRLEDAERCFKAAIKVAPSELEYYQQLAKLYRIRGDWDRWLSTLEDYLEQPDYGLSHFSVQSTIAFHFMWRKEWQKALPFAEKAAQCYSAWGLTCAAECHEALQNWEEAEKYYQATSERYRDDSMAWYLFCRRTGQGNLDAARRVAEEYAKYREGVEGGYSYPLITYYLLEGHPEKALPVIERAAASGCYSSDLLWLALVADEAKDTEKRDAALARIRSLAIGDEEEPEPAPTPLALLAELIQKDLAQGGKGQIDVETVDKLFVSFSGHDRICFNYGIARYLGLRGQHEVADRYGKRCMGWPRMDAAFRTLAGAMLLEHGITAADWNSELQPASAKTVEPPRNE